jgi:hypothetical protein
MALWILLNVTRYQAPGTPTGIVTVLPAGMTIDDTKIATAGITTAGGVLWPQSDPVVATAAALVQAAQAGAGINENDSQALLFAAALGSARNGAGSAALVQSVVIALPLATIQAETSGTAFNIGAALPTNARLDAVELNVLTALSGGGLSACHATIQNSVPETAGSVLASTSVYTGAAAVNGSPGAALGSNMYPSRGGQQLQMTLTAVGAALSAITAGSLSVRLFYTVQP